MRTSGCEPRGRGPAGTVSSNCPLQASSETSPHPCPWPRTPFQLSLGHQSLLQWRYSCTWSHSCLWFYLLPPLTGPPGWTLCLVYLLIVAPSAPSSSSLAEQLCTCCSPTPGLPQVPPGSPFSCVRTTQNEVPWDNCSLSREVYLARCSLVKVLDDIGTTALLSDSNWVALNHLGSTCICICANLVLWFKLS